jgi:lipopolysaccharide transport system permease protein
MHYRATTARTASPDARSTKPSDSAHRRARTYLRPRRGWQAVNARELWQARDLLWMFTIRDVQVRYKQTFFGFGWALVVPVVQVFVFTVFFGMVLGVSARVNEAAGRVLPYPLFALTGQMLWNLFKSTVDGASTSLMNNANIVRRIYVPRLVLPLSSVGRPLVDTLMVFLLMIGMTWWYATGGHYDVELSWTIALSPLLLFGTLVPALAIGLLVAAVTVHYRDLQYVLPFFTSILFYVTPVIYSVDVLPPRLAALIHLNPVAGFVAAHRAAVMGLPIDWSGFGVSLALSTGLLVLGLFYFARAEREFADVA